MAPIRIQRKRTKGFKLPPNTVCVTRGTPLGNPFKVGETYEIDWEYPCYGWGKAIGFVGGELIHITDNKKAVEVFEKWIEIVPIPKPLLATIKDKNVACFCPLDKPCHADILLKLANQ